MMALTSLMTMSFKTLKKSNISLAFSPIFPIITPKATKNPIKPEGHGIISPMIVLLPGMLAIVEMKQLHLPKTFIPPLN